MEVLTTLSLACNAALVTAAWILWGQKKSALFDAERNLVMARADVEEKFHQLEAINSEVNELQKKVNALTISSGLRR